MPSASSITLAIDTVRTLSMDAVQQAESGHPGTPMALAPLAYALYTRHVKHNPADPHWPDRDRVVLSAGHASMLLYSTLFLSGYDLTLDDLKAFRQWGSKTPGHPEVGHTAGVETTTGPLGQGIGNAVGMAVAEAQLAATFNQDGHTPIDHYTWFIAGDGCLMEGISHEAASFAGHQRLGKLIGFWDDNDITIDGRVSLASRDDVAARFAAYGWQVLHLTEVNDQDAIDRVIAEAKADTARPTLICTKTIIGYGSPNRADTAKAHGEPLGKDEILLTKQAYGWPSTEPFHVPAEALTHWRETKTRGVALQKAWMDHFMAFTKAQPVAAKELGRRWHGDLPTGWEKTLPKFDAVTGNVASRAASGTVLNAIAPALPELLGGSADLTGSNLTDVKGGALFSAEDRTGRNFRYGIREHGMGAIMNGMALHGGVIPYGGTFLVFADYMRPAIRLAALMKQRVIYVFTHDSIGLGEDGPTHQPVEHLTSLRCIPNLLVLRPADANEVAECWRIALMHRDGPSAIILTRQKLSCVDRTTHAPAIDATKGAYILKDAPSGTTPAAVILASGSEVEIALAAQAELASSGIATRVVSMCSMELFAAQDAAYRASVLPNGIRRVAIEAAHPMSWQRWVGDTGTIIGIATFGASAPAPTLYREYGITANAVVRAVRG
jgi:transketolase